MSRLIRRELIFLIAVVILAMSVRAAFTALPRVVRWDEAAYQLIARSLLQGKGYAEVVGARDLQQPPVVAYLSVFGRALGLAIPWSTAALAHVLLGGLIPVPVYLLGRDLKSRRIGALASLLVALHPALAVSPLYWSTMTEPPYVLFMLCGIYAAWRAATADRHPGAQVELQEAAESKGAAGWRWCLLMGASFGLAYLTRPEAMAYLLALLVFILLWRGRVALRRHEALPVLGQVLAAGAVFLLVCTPYIIYVHRVTGRWALSGKQGVTMGISWAYAQGSQAEHDRVTASLDPSGKEILWLSAESYDISLIEWVRQNPARFAALLRHNVAAFIAALFQSDLFHPWQIVLMALGLFAAPWMRRRAGRELFLIWALAPTLALILFFVLTRFMALVVALGMLWTAEGLGVLLAWGQETAYHLTAEGRLTVGRLLARASWLIVPAAAVLLLVEGGAVSRHERVSQPFDRVQAAAWLKANAPSGSPIMLRNSEIALYADLPQVAFPNAPWDQVLAYARSRGARYLVVDDKEIQTIRPALSPLLDPDAVEPLPDLIPLVRLKAATRTNLIFAIR